MPKNSSFWARVAIKDSPDATTLRYSRGSKRRAVYARSGRQLSFLAKQTGANALVFPYEPAWIIGRTKGDNPIPVGNSPIIDQRMGPERMAANPVVLYFEKQEDALLFTLAASSVMSGEGPEQGSDAVAKIAEQICKASRITAKGVLNNM